MYISHSQKRVADFYRPTHKPTKLINELSSHFSYTFPQTIQPIDCFLLYILTWKFIFRIQSTVTGMSGGVGGVDLPLLWDVIGAQAVVELSTAISLKAFPSTLTLRLTNDRNRCLHNSSGVCTSRNVSRNLRNIS